MKKSREVISGKEDEWIIEWDGGHAIKRGVTAFEAHSRAHGAPAFGSCRVWGWEVKECSK